jgi:threonylcarbamoyladenosine tRNA methylthiotransferase MtaB
MRVAFYRLGCKLNQAETESLAIRFSQAGFQLVAPDDMADVYVANTCTVTHVADRKSRRWLRMVRRKNPRAFIVATGCYAQRSPQELAPLADLVVDNTKKEHLLALIQTLPLDGRGLGAGEAKQFQLPATTVRTRTMIKIQDGCYGPCTYCIVPHVRPREYSLPTSDIIDEVKQKVDLGYKEVVLTGTKVGSYSHDGCDLKGLIRRVLRETKVPRLRLSSLQPSEISLQLLDLWQDERLCRHFHLALQSGSDTVLQRMNRSYSLDQYGKTINLIREKMPDAAITTDIMVGFPGETDEEFEQSYSFCQQAGFANIHVFPFSPRPETKAARMTAQITDSVKQERNQRMLELSQLLRQRFLEQFLGQTMPVLWEKEVNPGSSVYSGLTSNYIRVFARSEKPLCNKITRARLDKLCGQGVWGELVNENTG